MAGTPTGLGSPRCFVIFLYLSQLVSGIASNDTALQSNSSSSYSTNTTIASNPLSDPAPTPLSQIIDPTEPASSDTREPQLGDFIASGLALSRISSSSSDSAVTSTDTAISSSANGAHVINSTSEAPYTTSASAWPSSGLPHSNGTVANLMSPAPGNESMHALSKSNLSISAVMKSTATANISAFHNSSSLRQFPSVTYTGDCWEQWNQYWEANSSLTDITTVWSTATTSGVYTQYYISRTTWTSYTLRTVTDWAANFPVNTYTTSAMIRGVEASTSSFKLVSFLNTYTGYGTSDMWPNATITPPPCALPTRLPQCQSSWENWATARYADLPHPSGCDPFDSTDLPKTCSDKMSGWSASEPAWESGRSAHPPPCTQAALGASFCSGLRSSFEAAGTSSDTDYGDDDGVLGMTRIEATINGTDTWYDTWPAETNLAPGCTLGCGECNLQGGTVELIFWQPASTTWIDGRFTALSDNATALVTVDTLGTTLTSPTVYISFESLWARNSCSRFGRTIVNTIIPITDTASLQSLYGYGRYDRKQKTASFNFTDIYVSPVPEYIFMSQPRCASSYSAYPRGLRKGPPPLPANWTCPRTIEYEPILAIPIEVKSLDPEWISCRAGYRGIYDPPLALTPKASIALPTMKGPSAPTTSAAPAPTPKSTSAPKTDPPKSVPTTKPDSPTEPPQNDPPVGPGPGSGNPSDPQKPATGNGGDPDTTSGKPIDPQRPHMGDSSGNGQDASQSEEPNHNGAGNPDPPQDEHNGIQGQQEGIDKPTTGALPQQQPTPSNAQRPTNAVDVLTAALPQTGNSGVQVAHDPDDGNAGHDEGDLAQTPNDHNQFGSSDSSDRPAISDLVVIPLADGTKATVVRSGSSIIINQGTSSTSLAASDGSGHLGSHSFSISDAGSSVTVDGTDVHDLPISADERLESPVSLGTIATWTHQGDAFTAFSQGGSVALFGSATSTVISPGAKATFAGQIIALPADGENLIHDSSIAPFSSVNENDHVYAGKEAPVATWPADGQTFTAVLRGSSLVVNAGDATITIPAGETSTLLGHAIQNAASNNALVHDGVTQQLERPTSSLSQNPSFAIWTVDGQTFVALKKDREIVFMGGGVTSTLSAGSVATIAGKAVSVLPGGIVAYDGITRTINEASRATSISAQHASTWLFDHKSYTAIKQGGNLLIAEGGTTSTFHPGARVTIGDQTLSVLTDGGFTIIGEATTTSLTTDSSGPGKVRSSDPASIGEDSSGSQPLESKAEARPRGLSMVLLICFITFGIV